jgi:glycerol kinase
MTQHRQRFAARIRTNLSSPGWVEHDPMEIWATQSSAGEVLAKADINR